MYGCRSQGKYWTYWGPVVWRDTTGSAPNSVLANSMAKTREKDKKRKSDEKYKGNRRKRKYERCEDTIQARKSYSRHDGAIEPDDICEDISPDHMQELGQKFYHTNVVVTQDQASQIEGSTKSQSDSVLWMEERRKRITASKVGGIAKMKPATKRAKKVEDMLHTSFQAVQLQDMAC